MILYALLYIVTVGINSVNKNIFNSRKIVMYIFNCDIKNLPKNTTLLGNTKKKIMAKLNNNLKHKNTLESINISIELHISGYLDILLNKLITYYFQNINLAQPRGVLYVYTFLNYYNKHYSKKDKKNIPLNIINDTVIRNFICLFVTLLCGSNHRKLKLLMKFTDTEFNLKKKKKTLFSQNLNLVMKYININEDNNVVLALSEIIILLNKKELLDRESLIIYWINWIFEYDKLYKNKNLKLINELDITGIDTKHKYDYIWILWKMIIDTSPTHFVKVIKKLEWIYKYYFTKGNKRSKIYLLFTGLYLNINPSPKINNNINYIEDDLFTRMNIASLKSNTKYVSIYNKRIGNY